MKTPLTQGNPIPPSCRCWMVRGEDHPYREICDRFSPNPFSTLRLAGDLIVELCYDCEHPEACHGAPVAA